MSQMALKRCNTTDDGLLSKSLSSTILPLTSIRRFNGQIQPIKHSGYLLKRSNKPYSYSHTQEISNGSSYTLTTPDSATDEVITNTEISKPLTSQDANHSYLDSYNQQINEFPKKKALHQSKENVPSCSQNKVCQENEDSQDTIEFAKLFFQFDISENLSTAKETLSNVGNRIDSHDNVTLNPTCYGSAPNLQEGSYMLSNQAISEPITIGTPHSESTKKKKIATNACVHESLTNYDPIVCGNQNTAYEGQNMCDVIDEKDGHIWRKKFCILEDGVLYFYRNSQDGNLLKARQEREQFSPLNNPPGTSTDEKGMSSEDYLGKSPVARNTNPLIKTAERLGIGGSLCHDNSVMWEKRVALDKVGAVRSAEVDYGYRSLELISMDFDDNPSSVDYKNENNDHLILRAESTAEMNEWMFQFHRSLALFMKQIVREMVGSNKYDSREKLDESSKKNDHEKSRPLLVAGDLFSKVGSKLNVCDSFSPGTLSTSLSHGHGRSGFHRRRIKNSTNKQTQSYVTCTLVEDLLEANDSCSEKSCIGENLSYNEISEEPRNIFRSREVDDLNYSNRVINDQKKSITKIGNFHSISSNEVDKFSQPKADHQIDVANNKIEEILDSPRIKSSLVDVGEEASISKVRLAGHYIPPHLRQKKYVPPHLRRLEEKPYSNINSSKPNILQKSQVAEIDPLLNQVESCMNRMEALSDKNNILGTDATKLEGITVNTACSIEKLIKLGGCADPNAAKLSITNPIYVPRKSSKVGKTRMDPYGCFGGGSTNNDSNSTLWEVGAYSECGIRDSNEDSYLIVNNLSSFFSSEEKDVSNNPIKNNHGLFAIFDGHCGNQTARFAAEMFPIILFEESKAFSPYWFTNEEMIKQLVTKTMRTLDHKFCQLCSEDGREWDCGATAIISLIIGETLVVANLGDSNGVLCCSALPNSFKDKNDWTVLEPDEYDISRNKLEGESNIYWKEVAEIHSPSRKDEKERIEAANGWITTEKEIPISQLQRMDFYDEDVVEILRRCFSDRLGINQKSNVEKRGHAEPNRILQIFRVCGELAVSRALGDLDFKASYNSNLSRHTGNTTTDDSERSKECWKCSLPLPYPEGHNCEFRGDLVSCIPEIKFFKIDSNNLDKCLLLASDGLWDVMDADDAVRIIRNLLFEKGWSAKEAASRLAEVAVHLGSSDNITVLVIRFN